MVLRNRRSKSDNGPVAEAVAPEPNAIRPADVNGSADRKRFLRPVRKRLKKFVSFIPAVLKGDEAEAVHDVRVWSRRLQQSLISLSPNSSKNLKRLRRTLRGVRRAVGDWRNCDVALDLLARERGLNHARRKPDSWKLVAKYVAEKRSGEIARARGKLRKCDPADFSRRVRKLLEQLGEAKDSRKMAAALSASVETAWRQWHSALAQARKTRTTDDLHRFRIACKRLRYRIELLRDLGNKDTRPAIQWLKALQEAVGLWHDQQALREVTAEALARPEFLLSESETARALLSELEKRRMQESEAVESIFRLAQTLPEEHLATKGKR